jgi:hypothetical protein
MPNIASTADSGSPICRTICWLRCSRKGRVKPKPNERQLKHVHNQIIQLSIVALFTLIAAVWLFSADNRHVWLPYEF